MKKWSTGSARRCGRRQFSGKKFALDNSYYPNQDGRQPGGFVLMRRHPHLHFTLLSALLFGVMAPWTPAQSVTLKVDDYPIASPERATTRAYNEFQRLHPDVRLEPFSSLRLESGGARGMESTKLLCFAANIGPDVVHIPVANVLSYAKNGFVMDLSEFIGCDKDGDGYISDDEATWEPWRSIPPVFRHAVTIDGKPYAIPTHAIIESLVYRKDLLDQLLRQSKVKHPPQTWGELLYLCQKATQHGLGMGGTRFGRRGIHLNGGRGIWDALIWSSGAQFIEPTGRKDPEQCRASFASSQGQAATEFFWRMSWAPWVSDPRRDEATGDYEPINLSLADVQRGSIVMPDRREIRFEAGKVHWGVARGTAPGDDVDILNALAEGEVVFLFGQPGYIFRNAFLRTGISTRQLGFCAVPAGPAPDGRPVVVEQREFWGLSRALLSDSKRRQAAFDVLSWLYLQLSVNEVRQLVEEGHADIVAPAMLRRADYAEYADQVPAHLAEAFGTVEQLKVAGPFAPAWGAVREELIEGVLAQLIASKDYDFRRGLKAAQEQANRTVLAATKSPASVESHQSTRILIGLLVLIPIVLLAIGIKAIRATHLDSRAVVKVGTSRGVTSTLVPWLLLLPALGLIALWSYYPMIKGSVMSFQDYSIAGQSKWVGLENFFIVLGDPRFYKFILITCKFTFWSLVLGFLSPIALALLLDEVPHFKFSFRMVYLLPNVCAGLVIVFLWKMMFYPTEAGFLNSLMLRMRLLREPLRFYQDPDMALLCCIIPGVWASAGIGSLIYLAALKGVGNELYEAAEMDGATLWRRLWHITLPTIKPLILIQFVGAFIGTVQTMGNIFVMTGGGPDGETTVLALKIWKDAFVYLDFGRSTATAWMLGSALIGFTIWQLRLLRRVEFRRAEIN